MRILFIGHRVERREDLFNFSGVWSFYLRREFEARGVQVRFMPAHKDVLGYTGVGNGVDHAIALGTRHFSKTALGCATALHASVNGAVCQLHDSAVRPLTGVDVTFCVRGDIPLKWAPVNHHVGWAADPEVCRSTQDPDTLGILIDHPDYVMRKARTDYSRRIVNEVAAFVASGTWRQRFRSVRVRRIADGFIEDVDLDKPSVPRFTRKHVTFEEVAHDYSRAHLFFPTHREGVGLSVLETALCGALPVVPVDCISPSLLATVRHLDYRGRIPWQVALGHIDVAASRETAMPNSWSAVADRILSWLEAFKRGEQSSEAP